MTEVADVGPDVGAHRAFVVPSALRYQGVSGYLLAGAVGGPSSAGAEGANEGWGGGAAELHARRLYH